jgi:hypothetical protein
MRNAGLIWGLSTELVACSAPLQCSGCCEGNSQAVPAFVVWPGQCGLSVRSVVLGGCTSLIERTAVPGGKGQGPAAVSAQIHSCNKTAGGVQAQDLQGRVGQGQDLQGRVGQGHVCRGKICRGELGRGTCSRARSAGPSCAGVHVQGQDLQGRLFAARQGVLLRCCCPHSIPSEQHVADRHRPWQPISHMFVNLVNRATRWPYGGLAREDDSRSV